MYVAPRPIHDDDPHFAVRLSLAVVLTFMIGAVMRSPMMMIYPAMAVGIYAGNLKAFDMGRIAGAPIVITIVLWLSTFVISVLTPYPLVLLIVLLAIYTLAFFIIQRTGNPVGMMLAIFPALVSVMGLDSPQAMFLLRDEMSKAAFVAALVAPLLYTVLPPRASEVHKPEYVPSHDEGQYLLRAAIRGFVLLVFSMWLYLVAGSANVMFVVAGVFVLSFPTRKSLFAEAFERTVSTLIGGGVALAILNFAEIAGHAPVILAALFIGTLSLATRMFHGRLPPMVYQFAVSVLVSVVGGGLTTQEPLYNTATRLILTLGGAIAAAFLTALLESLLLRRTGDPDIAPPLPAAPRTAVPGE